jgi:hypothetical protein
MVYIYRKAVAERCFKDNDYRKFYILKKLLPAFLLAKTHTKLSPLQTERLPTLAFMVAAAYMLKPQ